MNSSLKHIIFISLYYPPFNHIASQRGKKLVEGLREKNFKVTVITTKRGIRNELPEDNNIDTHYINLLNFDKHIVLSKENGHKFYTYFFILLNKILFPFGNYLPEIGLAVWRKKAIKKAIAIHKQNPADLIYTSSGPPASAVIGYKFKTKTNVPWIPEFRDLWSLYHNKDNNYLLKKYNQIKEKKYIKQANAVITVTKVLKEQLIELHNKPTYVVYNSFEKIKPEYQITTGKLIITYAGTIIIGRSDPSPLFEAIRMMRERNDILLEKLILQFYVSKPSYIYEIAKKYDIVDFVEIQGLISYKNIQKVLERSNIFLLLTHNHYDSRGVLTGKLFQYLSFKKPILALSYPGELKEILTETNAGVVINSPQKLMEFLKAALNAFEQTPGLGFSFNSDKILQYSAENQNKNLIGIINSIIYSEVN